MILCDFLGIINHTLDKCMALGHKFNPPTMCQRVDQLNTKNDFTKKVPPTDFTANI